MVCVGALRDATREEALDAALDADADADDDDRPGGKPLTRRAKPALAAGGPSLTTPANDATVRRWRKASACALARRVIALPLPSCVR